MAELADVAVIGAGMVGLGAARRSRAMSSSPAWSSALAGRCCGRTAPSNGDGHCRPSEYRSFSMPRSRRAAVKVSRIARPVSFRLARSALKFSS